MDNHHPMITIPLEDYNKLYKENHYLHNKLNDLTEFNNTLIKIIEDKNKIIEEVSKTIKTITSKT